MIIGFVSDIHEDINQLEKAFRVLEEQKCDFIVCLGDMVGYCLPYEGHGVKRDANEVLRLVKENCRFAVLGNHDLNAIKRLPFYKSDILYKKDWFNTELKDKMDEYYGRIWLYDDELPSSLTEQSISFLSSLNEVEIFETEAGKVLFHHFLFPDVPGCSVRSLGYHHIENKYFSFFDEQEAYISFFGHAHIEGCAFFTPKKLSIKPFGERKLKQVKTAIGVPCVIAASRKNGVLVYKPAENLVEAIPLSD